MLLQLYYTLVQYYTGNIKLHNVPTPFTKLTAEEKKNEKARIIRIRAFIKAVKN